MSKSVILLLLFVLAVGGGLAVGAYWLNTTALEARAGDVSSAASTDGLPLVWFGYVDLRQGTMGLSPVRPGRVTRVFVDEGQEVAGGAPLLQMDDVQAKLQVQEAQIALLAAEQQLAKAERLPAQFEAKIVQQNAAIEAVLHRIQAARQLMATKKKLQTESLVEQSEVIIADEQVKEIEAVQVGEKAKLAELKLNNPDLDLELARIAVARCRTKLAQAEDNLAEQTLKAPEAGTVMDILVQSGDVLGMAQRQSGIIFAPKGPRIVRAEIEQEFVTRMQVGQAVHIEDDTDATLFCKGKIAYLSDWFLPRRMLLQEPSAFNSGRTVECIISIDDPSPPLRIGQRVHVRVGG